MFAFTEAIVESYSHLQHLQLADDGDLVSVPEIDILVGADFYWHIVTGNVVRGESGPVAMETKLGYVLSGPVHDDGSNDASTNLITTHLLKAETVVNERDGALRKELDRFWDLDSIGIRQGEDIVHEQFNEGVKFKNGRYEVRLPWKQPQRMLPDNYNLCLGRLKGQVIRLWKDPELFQEYNDLIKKQVESGIVERVSVDDNTTVGKVHYIPHHPVIRRDKQTTNCIRCEC
jgi:hypothetical protein